MTQISMTITRGASAPVRLYVGWKGRHFYGEGGREPTALLRHPPAVIPAYNDRAVPLTEAIQKMSYELQLRFCNQVTRERWREPLHSHAFAMTNKSAGYGYPGGIPLRDYINKLDLTAMDGLKPSYPRYDKCRTYQGSFITGKQGFSVALALSYGFQMVRQIALRPRSIVGKFRQSFRALTAGNLIRCIPGVDGIDANKPLPSVDEIIDKVWYSISVATGDPPFHIRQQWGAGCVIVFPFIMLTETTFELAHFMPWDETSLPDPLVTYL